MKVNLLDKVKVMKSISKGCYPSHFNPSTERATLTCFTDMILMAGFTIEEYNNLIETGSIIVFYLVMIKYGDESKDELLKVETALEHDGMLRNIDHPQPVNVIMEKIRM